MNSVQSTGHTGSMSKKDQIEVIVHFELVLLVSSVSLFKFGIICSACAKSECACEFVCVDVYGVLLASRTAKQTEET